MSKLTLTDVANLYGNPTTAANTLNANNASIETALENTLSRDGTSPNQMQADLDLNNNDLINAGSVFASGIYIGGNSLQQASRWYVGAGVPSDSLGIPNDMYLNTTNGDVYGPKPQVGWGLPVDNITGPQGPAGLGDMVKSTYDPQNKSADAFARANHTGTQAYTTITGLGTAATQNTGVSGSVIAKLDGANTWSANQVFSGVVAINSLGLTTPLSATSGGTGVTSLGALSTAMGLGTMSTQSASSVAITGGSVNASVGSTTPATGAFTTVTASGTITPSQTAGLVGTTTNNNANAGSIGEYIQSEVLVGSAVSLTSGTSANVTSISLTAGDWDVNGTVGFSAGATTTISTLAATVNTTSATNPVAPGGGAYLFMSAAFNTGNAQVLPTGKRRLSLSATTTVYLIATSTFGVSTMGAYGGIYARRVR